MPHIRAENLRAAGYALAWVMSEDYGPRTAMRLSARAANSSRSRGARGSTPTSSNLRARARAIATYHLLDQETRDIYDGFAAGINRYVELRPEEFPAGMPSDFSGYDVATLDIGDGPPAAKVRRFLAAMKAAARAQRRPTWRPTALRDDRGRRTCRTTTTARTRGRSRRAGRSPGRRSCCGTRIWPGPPATTKRT